MSAAAPPLPGPAHPIPRESRFRREMVIAAVAVVLAVAVVAGFVLTRTSTPPTPEPGCGNRQRCGRPPVAAPPLVTGKLWRSSELRYQFEYDETRWGVEPGSQGPRGVKLVYRTGRYRAFLWFEAAPASEKSPQEMFADRRNALAQTIGEMKAETDPRKELIQPGVGYRSGGPIHPAPIGGLYGGTEDGPQGVGKPVMVVSMAAGDGTLSAVVTFVMDRNEDFLSGMFRRVDTILKSFRWPSEVAS